MNLLEINEIVVLTKIIFQKFTQNQNLKVLGKKNFDQKLLNHCLTIKSLSLVD